MKKAVIKTGGHQYLVGEGETLEVNLLESDAKIAKFEALMLIEGDKVNIGTPILSGVNVTADILEPLLKADKVTSIRYKAKKRVRKVRGHRQRLTRIKISKIA